MGERAHMAYLCDPASWIHPAWRERLAALGAPPRMARLLWRKSELSPFLIERFHLGLPPPLDLSHAPRRLLLMRSGILEEGLSRLGLLASLAQFRHILEGRAIRLWRERLGAASFDYARGLSDPPFNAAEPLPAQNARMEAVARGLVIFAGCLAPMDERHERRLRLKAPPSLFTRDFSKERAKIKGIGETGRIEAALMKIFSETAEEIWRG